MNEKCFDFNTHTCEDLGNPERVVDVRSLLWITPPLILVLDGGKVSSLDDCHGIPGRHLI